MLLVFAAPCQLLSLAGLEHGRTIPLAVLSHSASIAVLKEEAEVPLFGADLKTSPTSYLLKLTVTPCRLRPAVTAFQTVAPRHR